MKMFAKTSCLLLFFIGVTSYAQSVSGTVSSEDGPLPGATVIVKGTTNGTTTDFDGNFTINAAVGDVLQVSFVGFASQEVNVQSDQPISVNLSPGNELDEIVVTGYGTVVKRDATGAVDAIGSDSFDLVSADSPAQILRGKVAGVQITSSSGEPGAGVSIRVRGNTSVRSGNEPLIVVDGIPLAGGNISPGAEGVLGKGSAKNPLNFINQNDIESINVLKDASSTAIYGSRGANGVIVITTKKGAIGASEPRVTYSGAVSFASFAQNSSFNDVMSAKAFVANGGDNDGGSYNWQDAILRDATTVNHDITISKATENSSTRLSIGANLQDGIVKKTGMDKYSLSFFNANDLFDGNLNVQTRVLYTRIKENGQLITNDAGYMGNLIGAALYWIPTRNTGNEKVGYTSISNDYLNPVHLLDAYDDEGVTNRVLSSITSKLKLSEKLSFTSLIAIDNSTTSRASQIVPSIEIKDLQNNGLNGFARISKDQRFNRTFENTLNYSDQFDEWKLDVLMGYSYYNYISQGNWMTGTGFHANQTNLIDNIKGVNNQGRDIDSWKNEVELQSYFARATLVGEKILATLTYRIDGSSRFGTGNKYGAFPSVGLGYKLIEGASGAFNNVKLRLNWGITGNQEFKVNSAVAKANYENATPKVVTNANPNLVWETTTSYGVGTDFELLDGKISGSLDYFNKITQDLLFPTPEASTKPGPASPRFVNLPGELHNTGVEVGLNASLIDKEELTWELSANAAFLSNELKDFAGFIQTGGINGQGLSGAYAQVLTNNQPLYSYYVFDFQGYDAQGNSQYTQPDGSVGGLGSASKVLDKQALPTMNLGFSTSLRYKAFDVGTTFYGAFGHYLYNNTANAYFFRSAFPVRNLPESVIQSGQNSADPNSPSTKFLEKGDFLRWSNLSIGYTLSDSFKNSIRASNARIYLNINNLATFTDYSGFDPEVDIDKSMGGVPSSGMDYLTYPRNRSFALGIDLSF